MEKSPTSTCKHACPKNMQTYMRISILLYYLYLINILQLCNNKHNKSYASMEKIGSDRMVFVWKKKFVSEWWDGKPWE
jgi:hypothetical protein